MNWIIQPAIRYVPRKYLQLFSQQALRLLAFWYKGNNVQCPVDGRTYRKFLPYGRIHARCQRPLSWFAYLGTSSPVMALFTRQDDFFSKPIKLCT